MVNAYTTHHFFENRLYISPVPESRIKENIYSETGDEYKGAGIRSYSKPIGFILSFLSISSKITIGEKDFYINNKSFSKFIIRSNELGETNSIQEAAKKLHCLFVEHKKSGYDKHNLNSVNAAMKILYEKERPNFPQIVKYLKMVATLNSKSSKK